MGTISRRTFITGSAVLGASVLTGGILADCSSQTPSESQEQDQSQPNEQTQIQTDEQNADAVPVYFTSDISSAGLLQIWNSLGLEAPKNTAVKLSTGEPGGNNYLHPRISFMKSTALSLSAIPPTEVVAARPNRIFKQLPIMDSPQLLTSTSWMQMDHYRFP